MKHDSCKNCIHYWEPDCLLYPIPIRVYSPAKCYCEHHHPEKGNKQKKDEAVR